MSILVTKYSWLALGQGRRMGRHWWSVEYRSDQTEADWPWVGAEWQQLEPEEGRYSRHGLKRVFCDRRPSTVAVVHCSPWRVDTEDYRCFPLAIIQTCLNIRLHQINILFLLFDAHQCFLLPKYNKDSITFSNLSCDNFALHADCIPSTWHCIFVPYILFTYILI